MSSRSPAETQLNVIDFGLAKKYRDPLTGEHIPYHQDDHHGVGTSLFASIHTHDGIGAFHSSSRATFVNRQLRGLAA